MITGAAAGAEHRQQASKQASNNQALRQVMVDGWLVDVKVEECK
jgi:hypothetical protein